VRKIKDVFEPENENIKMKYWLLKQCLVGYYFYEDEVVYDYVYPHLTVEISISDSSSVFRFLGV